MRQQLLVMSGTALSNIKEPGKLCAPKVLPASHPFKPRGDCIHLGTVLEKKDVNGNHINCRGKWEHECELYGSCRINDPRADHNCAKCASYSDESAPIEGANYDVRHLLYHVYPMTDRGTWQRNCDQLLMRLPLFNGKRVCAIVEDDKTDPAGAVKQYLGDSFEYIVMPNDHMRREVATWVPLWERVVGLPGCTFYGHAKAVSRQWNPGVSCHLWADMMYETLLDYWPVVKDSLVSHPLTGSFKKVGRGFTGCTSRWHYSGSFFWTRNDLFRDIAWTKVPQQWWGTEAFPGTVFPAERAGCVFHAGVHPRLNIYDPGYVNRVVLPELREWRSKNTANRTDIGQFQMSSIPG